MALTQYSYNIIADFPNSKVDNYRLYLELETSTITKTLNRVDTDSGNCNIWYEDALSGAEEIILDGYVAAHLGERLPEPDPFADGAYFGDATSLDPSAIVEMSSTTRGLLIPRMTTAEMDAISSPSEGLIVYNTSLDSIMSYDAGSWEEQRDAKKISGVSIQGTPSIDGYGLRYNSDGYFEYKPFPRVIAFTDSTERLNFNAIEGDEGVQVDDATQWVYDGYSWIKRYGFFENYITVAKSGGQFTSIKDAIDFAISEGASASNKYLIKVYSGIYYEDPLTISSGIVLDGSFGLKENATIIANDPNNDLITLTGGEICGFDLEGVTNASKTIIRSAIPFIASNISEISITNCSTGIIAENNSNLIVRGLTISVVDLNKKVTTGVKITGANTNFISEGASFFITPYLPAIYGENPIQKIFHLTDGAKLYVFNSSFQHYYYDTTADAIFIEDGSKCIIQGCAFIYAANALHIGSVGSNSYVLSQGTSFENVNLIFNIESSTGIIYADISANSVTSSVVEGGKISGTLLDEGEKIFSIIGDSVYQYNNNDKVNFEKFFHDQISTGVSLGGELTDDGYGLFVTVAAGRGWISKNIPTETSLNVSWDGYSVALFANSTNYILYDSTLGGLKSQLSSPSNKQISLGVVITNETGIRYIHTIRRELSNLDKLLDNYLINTRKIALKSGLAVSAGSDGYKFNIDSGTWYRALDELTVDGYTDAVFSYFYGTDGYTEVSLQTNIDDGYYDNAGTLTALSDGYFKSDTVFITSDNKVSVLYGKEEFNSQLLAEAAEIPNSPSFIEFTACRLAKLVSEKGNGIVSIVDIRPDPNAATAISSGGGGVTDHGALSGLGDDDHIQYLLGDGSRSMSGDLDMNFNDIVNIVNIDGVDISSHASRHNPGGLDVLALGTPVAISVGSSPSEGSASSYVRSDHQHGIDVGAPVSVGTANAEGSASSVARSDHIHAHGDQTVATLHAVATTGANGFMSSSDKTKLDGVDTGATNTPLSDTNPVNVTKAVASAGSSSEAARQDHKHDVTTASAVANPPGTSSVEGSSTSLARADHTHALASFGSSAGTFCEGDDSRLSDARTPTGAASGDLGGTYPSPTVNDGADSTAIHDNINSEINAITQKISPVDIDILLIEDSADGYNKKKVTVTDLVSSTTPGLHASTHESGGTDVIDHQNLSGAGTNTHAQIDSHISSTSNPHSTDIGNLGSGTLAELNSIVTDATLDTNTASRPPSGAASGDLGGTYPSPTVNDGADSTAIHDNINSEINVISQKTTLVDEDLFIIEDSEDGYSKKKTTLSSVIPQVDTTYAATISSWTLSAGLYYADIVHNLGTKDVLVQLYTTNNDETVGVEAIDRTDINTVRIWVAIQENVRVLITTGGFSIGSTGVDTNAIHDNISGEILSVTEKTALINTDILLIEDSADGYNKKKAQLSNVLSGAFDANAIHDNVSNEISAITEKTTPVTSDLILIEDSAASNVKKKVQIGNLIYFTSRAFQADQFEDPVTADWTVNSLAPASADPTNSGILVRRFDDTTAEGVGFTVRIPTGATNISFEFLSRAITTPGGAVVVQLNLYRRGIPDNAAVTAWSSAYALTAINIPTNAFFQKDSQTIALSTLGLTAGRTHQFELTRNAGVTDTLTGDWALHSLIVGFS